MKTIRPGRGHSQEIVRCHLCKRAVFRINALDGSGVWRCASSGDCGSAMRLLRAPEKGLLMIDLDELRKLAEAAIERALALCSEVFSDILSDDFDITNWQRYENSFPVELLAALGTEGK